MLNKILYSLAKLRLKRKGAEVITNTGENTVMVSLTEEYVKKCFLEIAENNIDKNIKKFINIKFKCVDKTKNLSINLDEILINDIEIDKKFIHIEFINDSFVYQS